MIGWSASRRVMAAVRVRPLSSLALPGRDVGAPAAEICATVRAGGHGAVPAGVGPVSLLLDQKMAGFAGFSRVPADAATRGHTFPGIGGFGRQNAETDDSYFSELWGP
jgi:hypothetical protein